MFSQHNKIITGMNININIIFRDISLGNTGVDGVCKFNVGQVMVCVS